MQRKLPSNLDKISKALSSDQPVLIFDSDNREGETDIFFSAKNVTNSSINFLRKNGGGMIFLASEFHISKKLGLPFISDVYEAIAIKSGQFEILKKMGNHSLPYDKRSSFSIYINHKDTYTGITDNDRALTAYKFSELCAEASLLSREKSVELLANNFRSPGHLPICIADSNLLNGRQGHTELIVALLLLLELPPVALGCEMLSDKGTSLSPNDAKIWAKENGYPFLEGREIVEACL